VCGCGVRWEVKIRKFSPHPGREVGYFFFSAHPGEGRVGL